MLPRSCSSLHSTRIICFLFSRHFDTSPVLPLHYTMSYSGSRSSSSSLSTYDSAYGSYSGRNSRSSRDRGQDSHVSYQLDEPYRPSSRNKYGPTTIVYYSVRTPDGEPERGSERDRADRDRPVLSSASNRNSSDYYSDGRLSSYKPAYKSSGPSLSSGSRGGLCWYCDKFTSSQGFVSSSKSNKYVCSTCYGNDDCYRPAR